MKVLRSFLGGRRVPVVAVMRERAVVLRIGEDSGSGEFFVHPAATGRRNDDVESGATRRMDSREHLADDIRRGCPRAAESGVHRVIQRQSDFDRSGPRRPAR
jgi:hypothetical protein